MMWRRTDHVRTTARCSRPARQRDGPHRELEGHRPGVGSPVLDSTCRLTPTGWNNALDRLDAGKSDDSRAWNTAGAPKGTAEGLVSPGSARSVAVFRRNWVGQVLVAAGHARCVRLEWRGGECKQQRARRHFPCGEAGAEWICRCTTRLGWERFSRWHCCRPVPPTRRRSMASGPTKRPRAVVNRWKRQTRSSPLAKPSRSIHRRRGVVATIPPSPRRGSRFAPVSRLQTAWSCRTTTSCGGAALGRSPGPFSSTAGRRRAVLSMRHRITCESAAGIRGRKVGSEAAHGVLRDLVAVPLQLAPGPILVVDAQSATASLTTLRPRCARPDRFRCSVSR
jgi:hypothetical protein